MPPFEKKNSGVENSTATKGQPLPSRFGLLTKFKGELSCQEDVIIEGSFQGKINSRNHGIHIEKEANVKADIHAKNITVLGHVSGNIFATGSILIGEQAVMIGDLSAARISIQEGAQFKGTVKILPEAR